MSETDHIMSVSAHGTPPTATGIPVTAEWALWGKDARDAEYRLLACSDGHVSAATFVDQITSFSPGSAETWPQVTVSGFLSPNAVNYVALAIHDTAGGRRHDVAGREIVYTRYFCVPYPELAARQVGYQDMYGAFEGFWPAEHDRSAQQFDLPCADRPYRPAPPIGTRRLLAMRVAALLLTNRGVCVLGADGAGTSERLAFLDSVMSLLPYGMHSRLAGATWASSTAYELNLRLFFADSPRQGNDHVVWHQPEEGPIGHPYADQYLRWLSMNIPELEKRLAAVTEPMGFDPYEVAMMLSRLDVSYAKPPPPVAAVAPPPPAAQVADVLRECGNRLRGGQPDFLVTELEKLQGCLQFPVSLQDRTHFRQVIADEGLLRPHRSIDKQLQHELYRLLLQLAFEAPLTYGGYCEVEACLGQQPHKRLLQAMQPARLPDLRARLLAAHALGGSELKQILAGVRTLPAPLAAAAADTEVRADHAQILCELAIPALCECPDTPALRQSLHDHAYLAPTLQRLYPTQSQHQCEWLRRLLHASYGGRLDRRDIPAILTSPARAPSIALFAAVVQLTEPDDIPVAVYEFLADVIDHAKFDDPTREWLLRVLPVPALPDGNPRHLRARKRRGHRVRALLQDHLWLVRSSGQPEPGDNVHQLPPGGGG